MIYLTELSPYILDANCSVRQALAKLERSEHKFLLILKSDDSLAATLTDGDVRRHLLQTGDLEAPVLDVGNKLPRVLKERSRERAWDMIEEDGLAFIPVLDEGGKARGVFVALSETERVAGAAALVMAGGEGRRMRPLTESTPKPLIPVGDKPMIERIVEQLVHGGFRRIYVSVRYLGVQVIDFLGDGTRFGAEISYVTEDEPLGTMGCLSLVEFSDEIDACLVVNGDIVTALDFQRLYQFHKVTGAEMTVAVRRETYQIPFGVLDIDGTDIEGVREKPSLPFYINAGMYVVGKGVWASLAHGERRDATDLMQSLIKNRKRVSAFHFDDYWQDVGNVTSLKKAREDHGSFDAAGKRS